MPAVLRQCGQVYRELIKVNISPHEADKLELWQIAELMKGGETGTDGTGEVRTNEEFEDRSSALLRARVQAAREGREFNPDLEDLDEAQQPVVDVPGTVILGPVLE